MGYVLKDSEFKEKTPEDLLRGHLPHFKESGERKRIEVAPVPNFVPYMEGKINAVRTRRELYDHYRHFMKITLQYLLCSFVSAVIAVAAVQNLLLTGDTFWGLVGTVFGVAAGFYFRHGVGKYGNIAVFENMPVVEPVVDIFGEAKRTGWVLNKLK